MSNPHKRTAQINKAKKMVPTIVQLCLAQDLDHRAQSTWDLLQARPADWWQGVAKCAGVNSKTAPSAETVAHVIDCLRLMAEAQGFRRAS